MLVTTDSEPPHDMHSIPQDFSTKKTFIMFSTEYRSFVLWQHIRTTARYPSPYTPQGLISPDQIRARELLFVYVKWMSLGGLKRCAYSVICAAPLDMVMLMLDVLLKSHDSGTWTYTDEMCSGVWCALGLWFSGGDSPVNHVSVDQTTVRTPSG